MKNCNCAPGCPCDFWADPTYTKCEGMAGMKITEGRFGETPLDGLVWVVSYHWPQALHHGNGTLQAYISDSADEAQRSALLTILTGQAGNAWFEMLASLISTVHDPVFAPIEWEFDLGKRTARVHIAGEMETVTHPITNEATGDAHRILVDMPNGMEYFRAETATSAVLKSTGKVAYDCPMSHSSLAEVHHTHTGLVP